MLDLALENKKVSTRLTIKTLIAFFSVALAVTLPQIIHVSFGANGGVKFLPMYLPVLIAGFILGWRYGLIVGVLAPITSYLITSCFTSPMPIITRVPFMMIELGAFGLISGLFSKKINTKLYLVFPAVLITQLFGRTLFFLLVVIFQNVSNLSVGLIWNQIVQGIGGLLIQLLIVPLLVIFLQKLINRHGKC